MNLEHLENIEARWLAASGGPWSTLDFRVREGEDVNIIKTYEDAVAAGIVTDRDDWHTKLEEWQLTQWESPADVPYEAFRMVCTAPRGLIAAQERRTDKHYAWRGLMSGVPAPEELDPSFAILDEAKPEDVAFLLHAPADVGDLLTEVRKWRDKAANLAVSLVAEKMTSAKLAEDLKTSLETSKRLVQTARELIDLAEG